MFALQVPKQSSRFIPTKLSPLIINDLHSKSWDLLISDIRIINKSAQEVAQCCATSCALVYSSRLMSDVVMYAQGYPHFSVQILVSDGSLV